jgi:hypothetical protein
MLASARHERNAFSPLLILAVVLSIGLALLGITTATASGTTYYVDSNNGNDGNPGTSPGAAWRNLSMVNNRSFGPGDVINLVTGSSWTGSGGTSNALVINGGGAQGNPITVKSYGTGAAPVIRNPSGSNSRGVLVQAPWTVVNGLAVREAHEAAVFLAADHVVVQSNDLSQSGAGVLVQSQFNLITHNTMHDLTMVVNTPGGDDDYGAAAVLLKAPNNEVSYNTMINCKAQSNDYGVDGGGVELFGTVDNSKIHHNYARNVVGFSEAGGGTAQNIMVAYNVIVDSGIAIGLHNGGSFHTTVNNYHFENNTVVDQTGTGYSFFYMDGDPGNSSAFVVRNNIFYATGFWIAMQGNTNFTHDHNIYTYTNGGSPNYGLGTGERTGDPSFVNLGGGDMHLRAGSSAIDGGVSPAAYNSDFEGKGVPAGNGVDIGAYEYGGQAPNPTPVPPTPVPPAPTPPPASEPVLNPVNILTNGCFESGTNPWIFRSSAPADASLGQDAGDSRVSAHAAKVTINTADPNGTHNVQLREENMHVTAGQRYLVYFWAKASENRDIQTVVQQVAGPNTLYVNQFNGITTSWQAYSFEFTAAQTDTVFLGFNLAGNADTVWLDHVSLTALRPTYIPVAKK